MTGTLICCILGVLYWSVRLRNTLLKKGINICIFKVITTSLLLKTAKLNHLFGERSRAPDHSALIVGFRILHSVIKEHSLQINESTEQKRYKLKAIQDDFFYTGLVKANASHGDQPYRICKGNAIGN